MSFHLFGNMSLPQTVYFSNANFFIQIDPAYCTTVPHPLWDTHTHSAIVPHPLWDTRTHNAIVPHPLWDTPTHNTIIPHPL